MVDRCCLDVKYTKWLILSAKNIFTAVYNAPK